jgi:REP element-mobilizing transposase RayT
MPYNRDVHHRRSIRLPAYDYASTGAYFITIVTKNRECLFGDVVAGKLRHNPIGDIVSAEWARTGVIRAEVNLDVFVVMPNHIHAVVHLRAVGAHGRAPLRTVEASDPPYRAPRSLGSLVAGFKSAATSAVNRQRGTPGAPVWQRNYHERVIRSPAELIGIRRYIVDNPENWADDSENPIVVAAAQTRVGAVRELPVQAPPPQTTSGI